MGHILSVTISEVSLQSAYTKFDYVFEQLEISENIERKHI